MALPLLPTTSQPQLGLCVMYPSLGALERIGTDWDWIWIDAQHGDLDFREAAELVRASHFIQRPALMRVPAHDAGWISKALDTGAAGVIVPMIESVEEAKALVRMAKFPPLGNRSYGGRRVIDLQGRAYNQTANRDAALILQLESAEACALADEIASLDGVDGLFLGPDDLLIRKGIDVNAPKDATTIGKELAIVTEACRKHGKKSFCVAAAEPAMQLARELGCNFVVGGSDVGFLAQGSGATSARMRTFFCEPHPASSKPAATTLY